MKVIVGSGKKGWAEYVMRENKDHKKNEIKLIDGNINLNKKIISKSNYTANYTRIVLSFKGKIEDKKSEEIYQEWKELYFKNYNKDEYNITAVLHQDTENTHIHVCIPTRNLITNTRKDIYFDKHDRNRMNKIRDYLIIKHNLKTNVKTLNKNPTDKIDIINKWRKETRQIKLIPRQKPRQEKLQINLNQIIKNLIRSGEISSQQDIKDFIEKETKLKVIRTGTDIKSNFSYITIQDERGRKLRIKDDQYNENYDFEEALLYQEIQEEEETRNKIYDKNNNTFKIIKNIFNDKLEQEAEEEFKKKKTKLLEKTLNEMKVLTNKHKDFRNKNFSKTEKERLDEYRKNNTRTERENTSGPRTRRSIKTIRNITARTAANNTREEQNNRRITNKIIKNQSRTGATMPKLKKEIDIFKEDISLIDFAINCGYEFNDKKSCKTSAVLEKEGEKIIISKDEKTKHNIYFNVDSGKGGSIIDFYKNEINNKKQYWMILSDLRKYHKSGGYKYNLIPCKKDILEIQKEVLRLKPLNEMKQYLKDKKINEKTLQEFSAYIHLDNRNNISFVHNHFSFEEEKLKIETVGIERKNYDFKGHNGEKGLWGKKVGNSKDFYIFESPIDAISFYQLYQYEGNYISTGGSIGPKQIEDLKVLIEHQKPNTVNLCFDNDKAGNLLSENVSDSIFPYSTRSVKVERIKPIRKDFNEDLQKEEEQIIDIDIDDLIKKADEVCGTNILKEPESEEIDIEELDRIVEKAKRQEAEKKEERKKKKKIRSYGISR